MAVFGCGGISFLFLFFFERTRPAASMKSACLIYLSTSTDNGLPASSSRASCWKHLQFFSRWLPRQETKARERRGCCCGSPAAIYGRSVRLCCRAGCALCAAYGSSHTWYPDVAAVTRRTRWTAAACAFGMLFDFQRSTFWFWQSVVDHTLFRNLKHEGEHVWTRHQSTPLLIFISIYDFLLRFCFDMLEYTLGCWNYTVYVLLRCRQINDDMRS